MTEDAVIKTLDYIGDKLGIVIDWTAQNIYPQVIEILSRYRTMEIILNSSEFLLGVALIITFIVLLRKVFNEKIRCISEKRDNLFYEYCKCDGDTSATGITYILLTISIGLLLFGMPTLFCGFCELLKWIIVPETQYLGLLQSIM